VVHSDHASILHRYGDMALQILNARTWTRKERWKKGKRKGKGKEEVKEKGRWKEDSLRKVGRTHGHSGDFILSIGQTIISVIGQSDVMLQVHTWRMCRNGL